jgi:hypothetical protein
LLLAAAICLSIGLHILHSRYRKDFYFNIKHQVNCRKNSSSRDNARDKCLLRLQRKIHRNNLKVTTLSFTPNAKPRRYWWLYLGCRDNVLHPHITQQDVNKILKC